jgi:colanic acid/amylovoran biosynthesis glycosyltransferase
VKNVSNLLVTTIFILFCVNARALNILFVTGFFPHISQLFIQNQIIQLTKNGHQVRIHSFKPSKHDKVNDDVHTYGLVKKTTYGATLPPLNLFDLIYVQFGYHGQEVVQQAKNREFSGPIVVCFRGNDLSGYVQKDPHRYDVLFEQADLFLPVCDFFKDRLIELGCSESKIVVHHSAIPLDQFVYKKRTIGNQKALKLVSVARLSEKKGLDYAIQAVAQLVKKYPQLTYIIAGDADTNAAVEYKCYLQKLVMDLHLEHNVFLYGWATQEEVRTLLERADIFLLPSVTATDGSQEGIPNALKEAMAVGLPVIATNHAGNNELIEHKTTGILIHERNYAEITKAVTWYVKHPKETAKMTKAARKKIEDEFATIPTVAKLERLFEELLKQKRVVR